MKQKMELRQESFECLLSHVYSIVEDVARPCLTHSGGNEPTVEFTIYMVVQGPIWDVDDWAFDCWLSSECDDEALEFNFYCHFTDRKSWMNSQSRDGYFRYLREQVRQWLMDELNIVFVNEWGEEI